MGATSCQHWKIRLLEASGTFAFSKRPQRLQPPGLLTAAQAFARAVCPARPGPIARALPPPHAAWRIPRATAATIPRDLSTIFKQKAARKTHHSRQDAFRARIRIYVIAPGGPPPSLHTRMQTSLAEQKLKFLKFAEI